MFARRWTEDWGWALAAVAAGAAAGLSLIGGVSAFRIVAAVVAGAFAVAIVRDWRIGAVAMLASLPLDVAGRLISEPVALTVYQLALFLTLGSFVVAVLARRTRLRFSLVDIAWALLLFAAVWSLPLSLNPSATVVATVRLVFLWAFTLLMANALDSHRIAQLATWTVGITGLGSAVLAIAQTKVPGIGIGNIVAVAQSEDRFVYRAAAFFDDPNYLAGFLVTVIIVGLALLVFARSKASAAAWAVVVVTCLYALSITLSRTGYVGVAAGALVVVLVAPKPRRQWLMAAGATLVLAVVLVSPAALVGRIASIVDVQNDRSIATRVYMFASAAEMIEDNWAMGTGLAAFDVAYPPYRRIEARADISKPHQLPLAMWAEMGIAGLIAELVLVAMLVATFWRRRPRGWTGYEALAAAGIVSLLVQSLFQYYLYFEYLWLFIAFAVAATRMARREEETVDG